MPDHIRRDLVAGARAMVPWLAGVTPFGLVIGVTASQVDIPAAARRAIVTSAGLAVVCLALPLHLGIVVATVGGLAVVRTGKRYAAMLAGRPAYWIAALIPA